jgi:hypothetical protein
MADIIKERFFVLNDKKYFIAIPSANDIREADWNYSRTYTKSLNEGITTSAEMMDILRRRGIIGPEFEQRAQELTMELNKKIFELEVADTMEEKRNLAIEVAEARDALYAWNQRLNGPLNNTCENLADDARLDHLISCMLVDEDGNRVWKDYDSFLNDDNQELLLKARFEITTYLQGVDSDFLDKTPEALAMKEVEADVLNKAEEAAKAIEAVTAEEEAKKAEKETKKKTTAKKPTKKKPTKKSAKKTKDE